MSGSDAVIVCFILNFVKAAEFPLPVEGNELEIGKADRNFHLI